jgi:hypothetical protein
MPNSMTKMRVVAGAIAAAVIASGCSSPTGGNISSTTGIAEPGSLDARGTIYMSEAYGNSVIILRGSHESIIQGPRTHLTDPIGVSRQSSGDVVVVSPEGSIVTLPPRGGDTKPKYLITCHHFRPFGVVVDASSNIWVTEDRHNAILTYASTDQGCPTPRSFIRGRATGLADPTGVALDSTGRIIVDDASTSAVEVFVAGAHGNVTPAQVITGSATMLDRPQGLAVDANDNIWVTTCGTQCTPRVLEFRKDANANAKPIRVIGGSNTGLSQTIGIAISRTSGKIYVCSDHGLLVFAANANGNVRPVRILTPGTFPTAVSLPD